MQKGNWSTHSLTTAFDSSSDVRWPGLTGTGVGGAQEEADPCERGGTAAAASARIACATFPASALC